MIAGCAGGAWLVAGALVCALSQAPAQGAHQRAYRFTCTMCSTVAGGDTAPRMHILPALGLRVGIPQKASVAIGVVVGTEWSDGGSERSRDVVLYVEPGLSGGRASLGFVTAGGNMGAGVGISATVLRTWKDPWSLNANTTFVGGEVWAWPMFFVGPRVGVFRSIGASSLRGWYMTADVGFGL
jgi:hypothetical protein